MGCCVSSSNKAFDYDSQRSNQNRASDLISSPEEETVKEVLSETPATKVRRIEDGYRKMTYSLTLQKIRRERELEKYGDHKNAHLCDADEVSEASEICSTLSESFSTVALNEKTEYDGYNEQFGQRVVDKSPAKYRNRSRSGELNRERMTGQSPAKRSEMSPGRVRILPGRDTRGAITDGRRIDPGNRSERRSRSPGTRKNGVGSGKGAGRSSSMKTGKSPSRIGSGRTEETNKWPPTSGNESLENPLVSLECFIFL